MGSEAANEPIPGIPVRYLRKRWDPRRLGYVAEYECTRCLHVMVRDFHDRYPSWCPKCGTRLGKVTAKSGGSPWTLLPR